MSEEQKMEEQHLTDLGNAVRLVYLFGQDMRYCAARRSWYIWSGTHWQPDATGAAMRLAKATARSIFHSALTGLRRAELMTDPKKREEAVKAAQTLIRWALQSESRVRLEAMLKLAETELPVPVTVDQLDAEPWLLNVQNGTLDLRTGDLHEHRREDLITRICPVEYDPDAEDKKWTEFVEQVMPNEDVRHYVQKALGYSLTGTGTEGGLFLPFGPSHTGKTTLLEACRSALGSYAVTMDVETLTGSGRSRDGARPRFDILRLFGTRLVISTEVPAGVRLDEALVKKLTGGDSLVARGLYQQDGVESTGTFVIWLGSNHRPMVRDDDDAVWQRVRQVPFAEQHLGKKADRTLKPYLETEARPAVLAWLVAGAKAWQREGLEAPDAVVTLTEDYRMEMNPLSTWAEECCEFGPQYEATYALLRASYEEFTRRGDRPVGTRRFTNSLKKLPGVTYDDTNHAARMYKGIRVHDGLEQPDVEPGGTAERLNGGHSAQTPREDSSRMGFVTNGAPVSRRAVDTAAATYGGGP